MNVEKNNDFKGVFAALVTPMTEQCEIALNTLNDFVEAAENVKKLDPKKVRKSAEKYLMENVKWEFQRWFQDLYQLYLSAKNPKIKAWHYIKK